MLKWTLTGLMVVLTLVTAEAFRIVLNVVLEGGRFGYGAYHPDEFPLVVSLIGISVLTLVGGSGCAWVIARVRVIPLWVKLFGYALSMLHCAVIAFGFVGPGFFGVLIYGIPSIVFAAAVVSVINKSALTTGSLK